MIALLQHIVKFFRFKQGNKINNFVFLDLIYSVSSISNPTGWFGVEFPCEMLKKGVRYLNLMLGVTKADHMYLGAAKKAIRLKNLREKTYVI